jgi:hypothetical protein
MARDSYAFRLRGVAPADNAFRAAGEDVHRAFWRYIGQEGLVVWKRSRLMGLDRHGVPIESYAPLAASTRAKGRWRSHTGHGSAAAPFIVPAGQSSRAIDLLRVRAFADHAEYHWVTDPVTGLHWGQVMWWHKTGAGYLPARDVMGFSQAELMELAQRGAAWWSNYQRGVRVAAQIAARTVPIEHHHAEPPPKIPLTGRTDLEHGTAGEYTDVERTRRAIAEGYHTGFRQLRPEGLDRPAKGRRPPPLEPRIPAVRLPGELPVVRRPAAVASAVVEHKGLRFAPAVQAEEGHVTILADLKILGQSLAADTEAHVGTGGVGKSAKPGSYAGVKRFVETAKETGQAVEMPRLAFDASGEPIVIDGRHRLAFFTDKQFRFLPVSVPQAYSARFRQRYGALAF